MLFAGVGEGVIKLLEDAEQGKSSAYVIAIALGIYSVIVAAFVVRQWLIRKPNQTIFETGTNQMGLWISLAFALWVTIEIVRRLPG